MADKVPSKGEENATLTRVRRAVALANLECGIDMEDHLEVHTGSKKRIQTRSTNKKVDIPVLLSPDFSKAKPTKSLASTKGNSWNSRESTESLSSDKLSQEDEVFVGTNKGDFFLPMNPDTGIINILKDRKDGRFSTELAKDLEEGAYMHCLIPMKLGEALNSFLTNSKLQEPKERPNPKEAHFLDHELPNRNTTFPNSEHMIHNTGIMNKINEHDDFVAKTFDKHKHDFERSCKELAEEIGKIPAEDFLQTLNSTDLSKFRSFRTTISKWFTTNKHIILKISSKSTSREVVGFTLHCNSQSVSAKMEDEFFNEFETLRKTLENRASADVLAKAMSLHEDMKVSIGSILKSNDAILFLKGFRAVILNNKDISRDLIHHIPKTQGVFLKPSFQPRPHNSDQKYVHQPLPPREYPTKERMSRISKIQEDAHRGEPRRLNKPALASIPRRDLPLDPIPHRYGPTRPYPSMDYEEFEKPPYRPMDKYSEVLKRNTLPTHAMNDQQFYQDPRYPGHRDDRGYDAENRYDFPTYENDYIQKKERYSNNRRQRQGQEGRPFQGDYY
jgi:hypothetical protein